MIRSMAFLLMIAGLAAIDVRAQDLTLYAGSAEERAAAAMQRLTNKDAFVRQRAAEELARLRASGKRKLVEGYRLQEKNKRVQLALDWALYRMGKSENLYSIVRALDSPRHNQAYAYLIELESPEPLYPILSRVNDTTQIRLLEVLARIGDAETLKRIEPFFSSTDARIVDAARFAEREIRSRLESTSPQSVH